MEDDDFDFFEDATPADPGRKFQPADVLVLGFHFLRGVAQATANTFTYAQSVAAEHANFRTQQMNFHQAAALEIETLVSGDDDG